MTKTYRVLAQEIIFADQPQATVIYTVPEDTQTSISSIALINSGATQAEYNLGIVKAENVSSSVGVMTRNVYIIAGTPSTVAAYSADGITWTTVSMPLSSGWRSIASGNEKFVAVATNSSATAYSTNGITWTASTLPGSSSAFWSSVTYGGGKFVAVANASAAAYSTDGITWTASTMPSSPQWQSVTHGDGKFVAVSNFYAAAAYSTDGITWTASTLPSNPQWQSVTYGDGKFVAVANASAVAYSTDGITWTASTMPSDSNWKSVTYGDSKFVALGYNSSTVAYSTNGITWTASTLPSSQRWGGIAYGEGQFVAVATYSDFYAYSANGIAWTAASRLQTATSNSFRQSVGYLKVSSLSNNLSDYQTIIPNRFIESSAVDEIIGGITLSAGDQIRSSTEYSNLSIQVYGVEMT
jgi:hypothetical protein